LALTYFLTYFSLAHGVTPWVKMGLMGEIQRLANHKTKHPPAFRTTGEVETTVGQR